MLRTYVTHVRYVHTYVRIYGRTAVYMNEWRRPQSTFFLNYIAEKQASKQASKQARVPARFQLGARCLIHPPLISPSPRARGSREEANWNPSGTQKPSWNPAGTQLEPSNPAPEAASPETVVPKAAAPEVPAPEADALEASALDRH